jgi:hypothetical protein
MPCKEWLHKYVCDRARRCIGLDHVQWFYLRTLRKLLRRYGFEIENLEFGSGEARLYSYKFLPRVLRHTSVFVVAHKSVV